MKQFDKRNYKKIIAVIFCIVLAFMSSVGIAVAWIANHYFSVAEYTLSVEVDDSDFIDADYDLLADTAYIFDQRYTDYHLVLNQSVKTYFVNDSEEYGYISYTNVSSYEYTDNEALWTGIAYTGWVYKYLCAKAEGNSTMENYALDTLINMTDGLAHLMIVPNGGLGPEYGGILGRAFAPPDSKDIYPFIFNDHPKHFNGTGEYSDWRWRGYTSNDEHGGYYLFLAMAIKYLSDIEPIYETVSLIVDQMCNYMLDNNFLGIHGTGSTTGVNQKPTFGTGGFWNAILLKMGALCQPEKYEHIYLYFMANEMVYLSTSEAGLQETIANYFAYNFGHCNCLGFLLLEGTDSAIGKVFYEGYLNSIRAYTANHRNAWFNAIFLMIAYESGIDVDDLELMVADVEDQLMRFQNAHFPDLYYATPTELPAGYELLTPIKDFTETYNIGPWLQDFMGLDPTEETLNKPLTIDYMRTSMWVWEENPWINEPRLNEDLLYEQPGSSFTVPYWMLRYCGYIEEGGI